MSKDFGTWFVERFGRRPTTIRTNAMLLKIREVREDLKTLEELQRKAELWDEQELAARLAWELKGPKD